MKKVVVFILSLVCMCGVIGCNDNATDSTSEIEMVSNDYGKVIELAKAEFNEVFRNLRILQ